MKRILWISRRKPTLEQQKVLDTIFGRTKIVYYKRIVDAEEIPRLMEFFKCDEIVGTFDVVFYKRLIDMGIRPIKAVEQKIRPHEYKFKYFVRILNVEFSKLEKTESYKILLWFSRHQILDSEYAELNRFYKNFDIVKYHQIVNNSDDILSIMKNFRADEIIVVVEPTMYKDLIDKGVKPIKAVMKRVCANGRYVKEFAYFVRVEEFDYVILRPKVRPKDLYSMKS